MKASLITKLDQMVQRWQQLTTQLSDPKVIADQSQFRHLSQVFSELDPVVSAYKDYQALLQAIEDNKALLAEEKDAELIALIEEELSQDARKRDDMVVTLQTLLLPKDPDDERAVLVEIRAGTGGDEASLFVADLFRMYHRFCERNRWRTSIMNQHESECGGYKEIVLRVEAKGAYGQLKFESGTHRVQRIPVTESSGRIHTSACTVAVLPVPDTVEAVELDPSEIRVDTFRSSGAGGQHVNTTDSAIRLTHIPTGVVVECQDERSQHQNKAKAWVVLQAKLLQREKDAQQAAQTQARRDLVGSGDRSGRIRTYNFPQKRITDHRIQLSLYALSEVLDGDLDCLIIPLQQEHQADLMASLHEET